MYCCLTSGQAAASANVTAAGNRWKKSCTTFKLRTFKGKTKVTFTDHCAIAIEYPNAISKHKITVKNKWAFTQDGLEKFRDKKQL